MKIAVTSTGKTEKSEVDQRFGRARYFVLYDGDSKSYRTLDNEVNLNSMQGAGIQSGEMMAREGVEVLLTGHCGPKAFRTLEAAGIKVVTGVAGKVEEAVERFLKGELAEAGGPDVEGHWA